MLFLLKPHPDSPPSPAVQIEVAIAQHAGSLHLSYILSGRMSEIRIPPVTAPGRGTKLWQHTCFEAFVRAASGGEYYEFNFSPSTEWAAYRFSSYRAGIQDAAEVVASPIEVQAAHDRFTLNTVVQLGALSSLSRQVSWRLGLSAVVEDTSGRRSYWALAHPPGKPDFHHADCLAYEFLPVAQP
jgi:hypothetical protein